MFEEKKSSAAWPSALEKSMQMQFAWPSRGRKRLKGRECNPFAPDYAATFYRFRFSPPLRKTSSLVDTSGKLSRLSFSCLFFFFFLLFPVLFIVEADDTAAGASIKDEATTSSTATATTATQTPPTPSIQRPKMGIEVIDSPEDIIPIAAPDGESSVRSSIIFFSASLSMFAVIGIVLFFRKCVTCPLSRHRQSHHYEPPPNFANHMADLRSSPMMMTTTTGGHVRNDVQ